METEVPASVARLLDAIHKGGDFPAMARTIDEISSMTSSESTSSAALAEAILQDFGLTQKLLRLVNTFAYSQYGEVTTITRAVLLMGFDRVRSMATGLILFEHFRKQARSPHLVDVLNKAFYSAVIGRTIAHSTGFADGEEAFISTLYHRLGRILVAFYLPDDYAAIEAAPDGEREQSAIKVLGLSLQGMGLAVADELKMPERLRQSMTSVPSNNLNQAMSSSERLGCLATLANAMVDVLTAPGDANVRRDSVERLVASYGNQIQITEKVETLIARTVAEVSGAASTFKLQLPGTPLAASLAAWGLSDSGIGARARASQRGGLDTTEAGQEAASKPDSPETILSKGVLEVTALVIADNSIDDVLRAVLETVYRALGVGQARVLFLLKDPSAAVVRHRFGFGQAPDEMPLWAEVKVSGADDLFGQAFSRGRDVVIRNARGPGIAQTMPSWLVRRGVLDRFVVVLPLTVGSSRVGLFYIDGDKKIVSTLTPTFVDRLKVLRDHVVTSIQQRGGRKA